MGTSIVAETEKGPLVVSVRVLSRADSMVARVTVRTQLKYVRTDYMLPIPLWTASTILLERGRARMRTHTAAERIEGGAGGRTVAHHADGVLVALPLRSWLELWCVMSMLRLLQTNVHTYNARPASRSVALPSG